MTHQTPRLGRRARRWLVLPLLLLLLVIVADRLFPPPLARIDAPGSTLVVARDGTPLRAFADADGVWRYRVQLKDVSPRYLEALLSYEDRWFYRHPGINPASLLRAFGQALMSGHVVSGGSTLTMQVARMLEPISRSPLGKVKQIWRALQLEWRFSKDEILEIYLNLAPFGGSIEGVQAASHAYLGKSAAQLSDAEAALLVVLPQAPSRLRPDRHPAAAQQARDKVIGRLVALGVWDAARAADARIEQVAARRLRTPMHAALLAQRLRSRAGSAGIITSTLDSAIQARVEARVQAHLKRLPERNSVAVLVVENDSVDTLAYVGSADLLDTDRAGHVDMVRAPRSPGSTLKPLLYAMALDQGLIHSMSLLIDAPQSFDGYQPSNFMERFQGPVSATQALRLSLNVPAVDLLDRVGVVRFSSTLENAGLRLRMAQGATPNLALILGGGATTLEELVGAYLAIARGGLAAAPRLQIDDPINPRYLMSPGAAWIVRRMLERDPNDSLDSSSFASASRVSLAWKTGTSYGFRDSWALAVTPEHTIGVWIGRPDGTPLPGQFGAVTALPLLIEIADSLPTRQTRDLAPPPPSVSERQICWPLGSEVDAGDPRHCHQRWDAWVLNGTVPTTFPDREIATWRGALMQYWRDPSGRRRNLSCMASDAELVTVARWPALAYPWLSTALRQRSQLPDLAKGCVADEFSTGLRIGGLNDGSVLRTPSNRSGPIKVRVQALGTDGAVRWLLNERYVGSTRGPAVLDLQFDDAGDQYLIAIDSAGRHASLRVRTVLNAAKTD
ncbi:MAG: penicillin-binding protein 1C [Rhodanobacteraceae bacterium]|nr:penicillin-binding protein 1C [Rhodanobacteraceae bacterium]